MKKRIDLTGKRIGQMTVLEKSKEKAYGTQTQWLCLCDCGNEKLQTTSYLNSGRAKSCGCLYLKNQKKPNDITGKEFGRLVAIKKTNERSGGGVVWLCKCSCGKKTKVRQSHLKTGNVKSCGCFLSDKAKEQGEENALDLTGEKFGRLVAIKRDYSKGQKLKKKPVTYWLCKCDCGKETVVRRTALISGTTRSCGCYASELLKNRTGKNHPMYNHHLTDEERASRRTWPYNLKNKEWRESVFKRDSYTCVKCGDSKTTLNAHHKNSWDIFPEQRFDIENGETLCSSCHISFHKKFKFGKNTKNQFDEFLKIV